jgi:hypothetical protein
VVRVSCGLMNLEEFRGCCGDARIVVGVIIQMWGYFGGTFFRLVLCYYLFSSKLR